MKKEENIAKTVFYIVCPLILNWFFIFVSCVIKENCGCWGYLGYHDRPFFGLGNRCHAMIMIWYETRYVLLTKIESSLLQIDPVLCWNFSPDNFEFLILTSTILACFLSCSVLLFTFFVLIFKKCLGKVPPMSCVN